MKKIWGCIVLLCVILQACKNEAEQKAPVVAPVQLTGSWYKHFTGTIAGQPVDVNLCFYKDKITGSYYQANNGIPITMSCGEDSTPTDNNLYITEVSPAESSDGNDYTQNAHWTVTLAGNKLAGTWLSRDGKQTYLVDLKEDYAGGSYPFDIFVADSGAVWGIASATTAYMVSVPATTGMSAGERAFLDSVVRLGIACSAGTYKMCLAENNSYYLQNFIENTDTTNVSGDSMSYHGENSLDVWVMYNKNKLVVFEALGYQYTGGAHGMYGATYTCADVQERRVWELEHIMTVDTVKLAALMEQEARRIFSLKPEDSISSVLLVDIIPVTNNIYFTESGITFNYNPYEIASYAEGEISLFIPFTKLGSMLTADFKRRMALK